MKRRVIEMMSGNGNSYRGNYRSNGGELIEKVLEMFVEVEFGIGTPIPPSSFSFKTDTCSGR